MDIRIGMNTQEVFLGNIDSLERAEFTVIDNAVNVASGLAGMAHARQILITKETIVFLGSDMRCAGLLSTEVKRKTGKLEVFELLY